MLPLYHHALPQLSGSLFLTDAGLETDLVFNRGIAIHALNLSTRLTGEAEPGEIVVSNATEKTPRGFAIDPRGNFLLSVGTDSAGMTVYAIDHARNANCSSPAGWTGTADLL